MDEGLPVLGLGHGHTCEYDACATPFEIATMAAVVEGTVEVGSRQEWAVHYSFMP